MPGTKAERFEQYLLEPKDVNERMRRLLTYTVDRRNLSDEELDVYDKVFKDTFAPSTVINGEKIPDINTLSVNIRAYREEEAKLRVEKGREVIKWLKYYDQKDKEEQKDVQRDERGKNLNINKAIWTLSRNSTEAGISYFNSSLVGMCNEWDDVKKISEGKTAKDLVSEVVLRSYYPEYFSKEEEELYVLSILAPEGEEPKHISDNLLLHEELSSLQSEGRPWYTEEENKEFRKQNEDFLEAHKDIYDPKKCEEAEKVVESVKNTELPDDLDSYLNSDIPTFTNKKEIGNLETLCEMMLFADGKTLPEIENLKPFKFENLMGAREVSTRGLMAEVGEPSEFVYMVKAAVDKIHDLNVEMFEKNPFSYNDEKKEKMIEEQAKIQNFLVTQRLGIEDYSNVKSKLLTSKEDAKIEEVWRDDLSIGYNDAFANHKQGFQKDSSEYFDLLKKNGLDTDEKSRILSNFYAYKAVGNHSFDPHKPYDNNFVFGSADSYLHFLNENPLDLSDNPSALTDEKNKEVIKYHARFFRKWTELNVTSFRFEDYSSAKGLKGHENEAALMNSFSKDCVKNKQNILKKYGNEFAEAFGGKEYMDAIDDVNSVLENISLGAKTLADPEASITEKIAWKYMFTIASAQTGAIKGRNILEINPEPYCVERTSYFLENAKNILGEMTPKDAEAYIKNGSLDPDVSNKLRNLWDKSKEKVPSGLQESRRIVAASLGVPILKGDEKSTKTGLEEALVVPEFSMELKELLKTEGRMPSFSKRYISGDYMPHPPVMHGEGMISDIVTVANSVSLLMPPNLSDEQKALFVADRIREINGSKEERYALLDRICEKIDGFSFANYNLDCLTGKDNGKRNQFGFTESENDLMSLIKMTKTADSLVKLEEMCPDYFRERYPSMSSYFEYSGKLAKITSAKECIVSRLRANGIDYENLSEGEKVISNDSFSHNQEASLLSDFVERRNAIFTSRDTFTREGVFRFDVKDKDSAVSALMGIENLYTKTKPAGIGDKIGWKPFSGKNLYIDGIRADVYIKPYADKANHPYEDEERFVLEEFIAEGKHRVETVIPSIDRDGNVIPIVYTIEPMNKDSEKFYEKDPDRAKRLDMVKEDFFRSMGSASQFKSIVTAKEMKIPENVYDAFNEENRPQRTPSAPYNEVAAKHLEELSKIDSWYHKNSQEFKDVKEALKTPDNRQGVLTACDAYINKYFDEKGQYERATDLGNARMHKILEIKAFIIAENELDVRTAKMKSAQKKEVNKEQINLFKEESQKDNKGRIPGGVVKSNKELNEDAHKLEGNNFNKH